MKIYTCTDFTGVWPVGVAAVVVADCAAAAEHMLNVALRARGLPGDAEVHEAAAIDVDQPGVRFLADGNY
jgi:hypothetical protein